VVVGQVVFIHRNLFRVPFGTLLTKPLAVGVVVVPVSVLIAGRSALAGALAGAAAYTAALLALHYVTPEECRPVTTALRQPMGLVRRAR
jgi:hypothetical protein